MRPKRSRVLLLGPDGQLGRDIRRAHAAAVGPVDLVPVARDALDMAAPGAVERVLGGAAFDVVVNCAAYTAVDDAEDDAGRAFAVNAHAVGAMARACAAKGARLIHLSTDYVFGGGPHAAAPARGARADRAGQRLRRLQGDGRDPRPAPPESEDVVILRVASLFGTAGAGGRGGNFVETMIRAGREGGSLRVVDDQTMSPTAAADVAAVVMRMLAQGCEPGLYHVVNAGTATWFDFAREIVRRAGVGADVAPCATGEYPTRAPRPRYSALDNTRVTAVFGAMPAWQDGLERYLRARGH